MERHRRSSITFRRGILSKNTFYSAKYNFKTTSHSQSRYHRMFGSLALVNITFHDLLTNITGHPKSIFLPPNIPLHIRWNAQGTTSWILQSCVHRWVLRLYNSTSSQYTWGSTTAPFVSFKCQSSSWSNTRSYKTSHLWSSHGLMPQVFSHLFVVGNSASRVVEFSQSPLPQITYTSRSSSPSYDIKQCLKKCDKVYAHGTLLHCLKTVKWKSCLRRMLSFMICWGESQGGRWSWLLQEQEVCQLDFILTNTLP